MSCDSRTERVHPISDISSPEIQLMLPSLEMNYLNALMFYVNVVLMCVQLFVITISQRLKKPQSEIQSQNT